jgi:hypothetical protein
MRSTKWLFMYTVDFFDFKVLRNGMRFRILRKVNIVFALSINLLIPGQKISFHVSGVCICPVFKKNIEFCVIET